MIRLKHSDPNFPSHCNACKRALSEMDLSLETDSGTGPTIQVSFCSCCAKEIAELLAERVKSLGKKQGRPA